VYDVSADATRSRLSTVLSALPSDVSQVVVLARSSRVALSLHDGKK
jgi:hypothetical protein